MKALLLVLLIGLCGFLAYQKRDVLTGKVEAIKSTSTSSSSPASKRSTSNASATPSANTQPSGKYMPSLEDLKKLPANQFYLRRRISQTNANGIQALPAGSHVSLVQEVGAEYLVSDGRVAILTGGENLTRDPQEILKLLKEAP